MKQTEFARKIKKSAKHVSDLKNGRRGFSPTLAAQAEKITKISRLKWMYPEEYGDPWVELKNL